MRVFRSIAYNWRTDGPAGVARKVVHRAGRLIRFEYEALVYQLTDLTVEASDPGPGAEVRSLDMDGLLEARFFKAVGFPEDIRARFAQGETCVGVFFDGTLGHVSWMTPGLLHIDRGLPDIDIPGGVGIYDMFTLPDFRGRGAQTTALLTLCRDAARTDHDRAVALVREGNGASRHVFRKCGFDEVGTLRYRRTLGVERLDHPPL